MIIGVWRETGMGGESLYSRRRVARKGKRNISIECDQIDAKFTTNLVGVGAAERLRNPRAVQSFIPLFTHGSTVS